MKIYHQFKAKYMSFYKWGCLYTKLCIVEICLQDGKNSEANVSEY